MTATIDDIERADIDTVEPSPETTPPVALFATPHLAKPYTQGQRTLMGLAVVGAAVALCAGAYYVNRPTAEARAPRAATALRTSPANAAAQPKPRSPFGFGDPVPGYPIISPFGLRQLPWETHPRLHAGSDIAAPPGTYVHAVAAGTVARSGFEPGYGRYIEILHANGLHSFYAHLGSVLVGLEVGSKIAADAVIAQVGSTGSSTGAHLHFEVRDARERPLDPAFFLDRDFASADDWPIDDAAKISPKVRLAFVSATPEGMREWMIAKEEAQAFANAGRLASQFKFNDQGPPVTVEPIAEKPKTIESPVSEIVLPDPETPVVEATAPAPKPLDAPPPRRRAAFPSSF